MAISYIILHALELGCLDLGDTALGSFFGLAELRTILEFSLQVGLGLTNALSTVGSKR